MDLANHPLFETAPCTSKVRGTGRAVLTEPMLAAEVVTMPSKWRKRLDASSAWVIGAVILAAVIAWAFSS
jgi:uncharacterized membrane protein